jgi:hypothetical protein
MSRYHRYTDSNNERALDGQIASLRSRNANQNPLPPRAANEDDDDRITSRANPVSDDQITDGQLRAIAAQRAIRAAHNNATTFEFRSAFGCRAT